MKNILRFCGFGLIALCVSSAAYAQQTATPQQQTQTPQTSAEIQNNIDGQRFGAAKDLVTMMDMKGSFMSAFALISKALLPLVTRDNPNITPDIVKMITDKIGGAFMTHMDEMSNNAAMVYASTYTYDEIEQMIAFYKTPVGQKMLKSMPEVMRKTMTINQGLNAQASREGLAAVIVELKKRGLKVPKEMGI